MWTLGKNSSHQIQNYEEFNKLVREYQDTKKEELIQQIFLLAEDIVKNLRAPFSNLQLDEDFEKDRAIEFIFQYLCEKNYQASAVERIKRLTYDALKEEIGGDTIYASGIDFFSIDCDPGSRLHVENSLKKVLKNLPIRIRSAILYLLYFPERFPLFKYFCSDLLDQIIIINSLYILKNLIQTKNKKTFHFDFQLPTTQISRLLLVSTLYKLSPPLLVLLLLFRDLESLLQFCILFEGETIQLPAVETIVREIKKTSELGVKLEEEDISIRDRESLAYIATESQVLEETGHEEIVLNPILTSFFESIFNITLANYDEFQKKLIQEAHFGNIEEILSVYEVMNKEIVTQVNLLTKISSAVKEKEYLREVIEDIKEKGSTT